MRRRQFIAGLCATLATPVTALLPRSVLAQGSTPGNFDYVYSNPRLRETFLDFFTNVFHLYPEQEVHAALKELVKPGASDQQVYAAFQSALDDLRPFLGALRYAIPALKKQKAEMAAQTLQLVDADARYEGHLEIGSTGRYVSVLEDELNLAGEVFLLHTQEPGFGVEDIVERGRFSKIGTFVDMQDYSPAFANVIPRGSLSMVTVYIGFHHCPLQKREAFIGAVRDVMRPGGTLILRDHDVVNEDMKRIAALAHDTFNAGTDESWRFNQAELRN